MSSILNFILSNVKAMLYSIPVLLIAFPVHEFSHAFTAYKLGDPTAKMSGRLTLNPFKHLDILGTICLILFRFGWAKPVPVNPNNFKNPKGGMAVTSISGPLSNLILGFISIIFFELLGASTLGGPFWQIVYNFLYYSVIINVGLCIFNLIPLPPLDGEKILAFFLPENVEMFFERYAMQFQLVLLFLLFTPVLSAPLNYMVTNIVRNLDTIARIILRLQ